MYLKSLTLRGFKSFASATTLHLEPGITCVVGPNGSGKSNVVDALAWVMGEQGAKSLRGGAMADVVFAGTPTRPPLGRAEVALTIDNSDGVLPIEYTEVTISRTMFTSGGSEYAINGTPCRLLDITELLSDTGMGRSMHVIVGQGRLDDVLRATPEERRSFVEEAAGILKHRRRKERALRKLDQVSANLARLGDLVAEIRRQLGPLARQAEVARRASVAAAQARDARSRLLADDLAQARDAHERGSIDVERLTATRSQLETELEAARAALAAAEEQAARLAPALAEATDVYYRLTGVRERLNGTQRLASDRARLLVASTAATGGPDPDDLEAQAERARANERQVEAEVRVASEALADAVAARQEAEDAERLAQRSLATLQATIADRREGLATLAGRVAAVRGRVEAQTAELTRLQGVRSDAERRAQEAATEFAALELQVAGVQEGEEDLDSAHEQAQERLAQASDAVAAHEEDLRQASAEADRAQARLEALELSLERRDATAALLADTRLVGLAGRLPEALTVEAGWEGAVAAALGELADAALARGMDVALAALARAREGELGRAALVLADDDHASALAAGAGAAAPGQDDRAASDPRPPLPEGGVWAIELVSAQPHVRRAVAELLRGVAAAPGLEAAAAVLAVPDVRLVVTPAGEVLGRALAVGGTGATSPLELLAARDRALASREEARGRADRVRFALVPAREEETEARAEVSSTLAALHASDAAFTAVSERLGRLGAAARAARAEAERAERAIEAATSPRAEREAELAELTDRLALAQASPEHFASDLADATRAREELAQGAARARGAETEARLALRTAQERARQATSRTASLRRAAHAEREARLRAERAEAQRRSRAAVAERVRLAASQALGLVEDSLARAERERDAAQVRREALEKELAELRERTRRLATRLSEVTEAFHHDELARAEQRLRLEELARRSVDELALDPAELLASFGPHVPVAAEVSDGVGNEQNVVSDGVGNVPYVRADQERRLREAERVLARLGRINPLALEEHAALEERHAFLVSQVADVRKSRADLLEIVREIDERVERVFSSAWLDTEREFRLVFERLFPGGEGRLVLTDPDSMLTTGIEIEARPPGKKVRRLSLLSGGERSLTAVAFLVAIFRARPSPFYVMDEVEAALDDVNLGRLLEIFAELRASSQLIVVTHQRRTMEIADALYGVTMRDGVSTVIGQRIEREGAGERDDETES